MSCTAIAYCTRDSNSLKAFCGNASVARVSCETEITGKSSAGKVCKLKRLLPALRVRRLSSRSSVTVVLSEMARRMSCSFLAEVVRRKLPPAISPVLAVVIWISKSVARKLRVSPCFSMRTLARMGRVCRRSTMPVTALSGLSRASRSACRICIQ